MFRPFYWLDIDRTEKILSEMSAKGRHLKKMYFTAGVFTFENGQPQERTYLIRRSAGCRGKIPVKLRENGWVTVCGNRNNYAAFISEKDEVKPSKREYSKLLSIGKILCFFVICFIAGYLLGTSASVSERLALSPDNERYLSSPAEFYFETNLVKTIIYSALLLLSVIMLAVFQKAGKRYDSQDGSVVDMSFTIPRGRRTYTKEQEKQLIREKKMLASFRFGWVYDFIETERYVEKMEREGWNFYRLDKLGLVFYFIKGEPRKVRFVVDYQNDISEEYLSINIDSGWELCFKSYTKVGGYIVWLEEYDTEPPEFYSEKNALISRTKKMAVLYSVLLIPVFAVYILIARDILSKLTELTFESVLLIALWAIVLLEYTIIGLKVIIGSVRNIKMFNKKGE